MRVSADAWDTEAALRPWNLCITLDEPGAYGYRRRYLKYPGLALVWETFDAPCRLRGLATPDRLTLAVPLRVSPRSRYWGKPVTPEWLPALRSVGVDWIVARGQSHVILLIARALVRRNLDVQLQAALGRAASAHLVPVKPHAVEPLGASLLELIDGAAQAPETWPPTAVASLERDVLRQLVEAIDVPRLRDTRPDTLARRAGVERALEYLRFASLPKVKLSQLCEAAGVTPRTLEYGFRDLFDLTPLGFLHLLRLHAVRRELVAGDADAATIDAIADRWGFHQHGRFSGYYRAAFGELPSQTRARQGRGLGSETSLRAGRRPGVQRNGADAPVERQRQR